MRKILLATTAFIGVAFAGAAQAAAPASPISLNVGGYNDFVAGLDNGGQLAGAGNKTVKRDFEDEFKISFDALGKGSNGVEYGANIALWNGPEVSNSAGAWAGGSNSVVLNSAYVWLSGAFGKALFGDEHGASDLFVYAPTVGEGQIDGRYMDFVNSNHIAAAAIRASGFDNTEHSTKVTYYTPKVGNDTNKVQLGVSYAPSLYDYGQSVVKSTGTGGSGTNANSPVQDLIKGVAQYTGNFKPVNVTASAQWIHGGSGHNPLSGYTLGGGAGGTLAGIGGGTRDFNSWGLGTQVAFNGFTVGGAYNSLGNYNVVKGQDNNQHSYNVGAKYEFDKVGVALNWLHGKGYDNLLGTGTTAASTAANTNWVKNYNAYGAGATYTWFPGLTSNLDGVLFNQAVADPAVGTDNKAGGYTLLVSQRLAF